MGKGTGNRIRQKYENSGKKVKRTKTRIASKIRTTALLDEDFDSNKT